MQEEGCSCLFGAVDSKYFPEMDLNAIDLTPQQLSQLPLLQQTTATLYLERMVQCSMTILLQ